ncbi:hypothetical protein P153DRAFT_368675 [Dothidotthia symphoricarpi CBS 119687]|uniref:Secreted protein n=1 Tax=Dothidotthia symphoricarpi CBS 119687 TaxID=1392245 RepID=A0A6A6A6A9_9PLEO|nr:uncharacterized protein P153DRAFT_368675 [Dothidotthia symphoricarpi CBS 119687]KAF2127370.1 hypothetical protein P153DRAFT_368675 [Dothidotthia symphoricarpi CBS 119687]
MVSLFGVFTLLLHPLCSCFLKQLSIDGRTAFNGIDVPFQFIHIPAGFSPHYVVRYCALFLFCYYFGGSSSQ